MTLAIVIVLAVSLLFRPVLKPRNESQLVLRAKGKLLQSRGAATEKRRLRRLARTDN